MNSILTAAGLALVLAATAGEAVAEAPGNQIKAAEAAPAGRASDRDIEQALFKLLEDDPERVVCAHGARTGTRMAKPVCGTVRRWFNARHPGDVAANRAPWQLVGQIKKARNQVERRGPG
jgi:hypothetical protein